MTLFDRILPPSNDKDEAEWRERILAIVEREGYRPAILDDGAAVLTLHRLAHAERSAEAAASIRAELRGRFGGGRPRLRRVEP